MLPLPFACAKAAPLPVDHDAAIALCLHQLGCSLAPWRVTCLLPHLAASFGRAQLTCRSLRHLWWHVRLRLARPAGCDGWCAVRLNPIHGCIRLTLVVCHPSCCWAHAHSSTPTQPMCATQRLTIICPVYASRTHGDGHGRGGWPLVACCAGRRGAE